MPDDIRVLVARVSEAIRAGQIEDHETAYDAAVQLRRAADQIENSAIAKELRPWWDEPDPGVRVSQR